MNGGYPADQVSTVHFLFLLLIFQYICRLAVQYFADSLQRRETDCLSFSGFNIERLAGVISIFSASSPRDIFCAPS